MRSNSIIDTNYDVENIKRSITKALILKKKIDKKLLKIKNPYDYGNTSQKIINILDKKKTYQNLKIKKFYDL